jgi:endonuclease/exonuclease/phosphatase family metal-dependent hydrolase
MPDARTIPTIAFALALGVLIVAAPAGAATIKVMTYNTYHGGTRTGTTDGQLDTIAAQNPDVVVLQETQKSQLSYYVNGLNARMGTTKWHGAYGDNCYKGTKPTCTQYRGEGSMILTRLTTLSTQVALMWASDDYLVARASVRMLVQTSDGTQANVFVCHLPALSDAGTSRVTYVNEFVSWAASFGGIRLVGGDFNAHPGNTPIVMMEQHYTEAWSRLESGPGYTHANPSPTVQDDYWFSAGATVSSVAIIADKYSSDHRPVVATYSLSSSSSSTTTSTGEATVMSDTFTTADRTKWPGGVFTGTTDSTIGLNATASGLQVGSLRASSAGSHYNGISTASYNLSSNGSTSVQLVKAPNTATNAYAMLSVGSDGNNYYRWYESGNELVAEKKIGGAKSTLVNLPYSTTSHQFLRIRREYNSSTGVNEVVFETAPNNSGVPGAWTERHREKWNGSVNSTALRIELKAGTSESVVSPGSAYFDNFRAAINTK